MYHYVINVYIYGIKVNQGIGFNTITLIQSWTWIMKQSKNNWEYRISGLFLVVYQMISLIFQLFVNFPVSLAKLNVVFQNMKIPHWNRCSLSCLDKFQRIYVTYAYRYPSQDVTDCTLRRCTQIRTADILYNYNRMLFEMLSKILKNNQFL